MPFLIDDIFLRMVGLSTPPFDMIWLMETLADYVDEARVKENLQKINNRIRENRLLYELGEITKKEFEKTNSELNHQRLINKRIERVGLNQRTNLLN